jgi:O-antigen/teichoic acid export membrane protein
MAAFDNKTGVVWIGASQIVLLAVNFLLLKLMTSQLSVGSFGYYSLCMTIVLFARQVIYDPMSIVVAKNCASEIPDLRRVSDGFQIVRFVTDGLGVTLLFLGLIFWLLAYAVSDSSIDGVVAWSCFVYLCANGAQGIYFNVLNSIRDRKSAALFSMLDSILKLVLVFLVFWLFEREVVYTLMSISTGTFVVFLSVRYYIKRGFISSDFSVQSLKNIVKHSLIMSAPLYLPAFLGALKSVADRWIIAAFIGVDDLAVFSVLLQVGFFPMLLFIGMVQTFVAPKVYSLCAKKNGTGIGELKTFIHKILFGILIFASVASCVAISVADYIFQLFVGRDYRIFSNYLPVFIVSGALAAAAGVLHLAVIGVFETRVVGRLMIATVLISVAGTSLLIITWGFVGAVIGLLIASAASAFVYWFALYNGPLRLA